MSEQSTSPVLSRKHTHAVASAGNDLLKVESFFVDLISSFVHVSPYQVDELISEALCNLGTFFELDRGFIAQSDRDSSRFFISHYWYADHGKHDDVFACGQKVMDLFPWISKQIRQDKEIIISRFEELPPQAKREQDYWKQKGCGSIIVLPVARDNQVLGLVELEGAWSRVALTEGILRRIRIVVEVLATAFALKNNREELEDRLKFEEALGMLSTTFVNALPDHVDEYLVHGLQKVLQPLGVDFITLNQFDPEGNVVKLTHRTAKTDIMLLGSIYNIKLPWLTERLMKKELIQIDSIDNWPQEAIRERQVCIQNKIKSCLMVPFVVEPVTLGYLALNTTKKLKRWTDEDIRRARLVGEVIGNALSRKESDLKLKEAYKKVKQLKEKFESENIYLREEISLAHRHESIIGQSCAYKGALSRAEQVAPTDSTVLILGETGTGKELMANALHRMSSRKDRPMIKVNCAALPPTLMESELFGREKGAYTGALSRQLGRFEVADGSTIFLDEIGELPMELQAKLLRVLQEHQFERLGSSKTIAVDVRVIASTNRDLVAAVRQGRFREDLFYRLNVFPIVLPPLRQRKEDIPLLVHEFVREFVHSMGKRIETISRKSMDALLRYPWPGNVRELRNVIEQAMIICGGDTLEIRVPETHTQIPLDDDLTLAAAERQHIIKVLQSTGWRIKGTMGAAEKLQLHPATLHSKMKKLQIVRPARTDDISSLG